MKKKELAQYIKEELVKKDEVEIYLDIEDYKVIVDALEQEPCEELYRLITNSNSLMLLENYKTGERTVIEKRLEPCEDCISRAELLKAVDTWDKFGCDADTKLVPVKDCYVPYIHYDDVVKAIKGMPSIQPKLKTDEPMQVELEGDGYSDGKLVYDYGKCPKCGWEFEYGEKDWEEPYCCHCGQKLHWFESEDKE